MKKEMLLHVCCGPCATSTIKKVQSEGYLITLFYYNPNIHPKDEYEKRLKEAKKLARELGVKIITPEYRPLEYFDAIKVDSRLFPDLIYKKEGGFDPPKISIRCSNCWRLRLQETAQKARELKIKEIGTTLRISPYQDQGSLLLVAESIAADYGLRFYNENLVDKFSESIQISKERKMYRQKYCGCLFSKHYI